MYLGRHVNIALADVQFMRQMGTFMNLCGIIMFKRVFNFGYNVS